MIDDLTFIIAVRKGSKRIINKNIKSFAGSSLLEIKLKQICRVFKNPKIFFSSNCKKSINIAKKFTQNINIRPAYYCSSKVPMKEVYSYLASFIKTKYVCYLHVTSPLLTDRTLKKSVNLMNKILKKNISNYDSIATVTEVREYLWYKNKPINYDSSNHPRSQTLPVYQALNFAINIISKKKMHIEKRIVGKKFFPLILNYPENIDVDEIWQFHVAEKLYPIYKQKIHS